MKTRAQEGSLLMPHHQAMSASAAQTLLDLEKYAGWLESGAGPTRVRAGVKALGAAIADEGDVPHCVRSLHIDIAKLGSGGVATLLRRALRKISPGKPAQS
jgi:hypothetical protein